MTGKSLHDEIEDLDLARRQPRKPRAERALRFFEILLFEAPGERAVDRRNELGVVDRLFDKVFALRI